MKDGLEALSIHPCWTSDHCDLRVSEHFRIPVYGTVGVVTAVYLYQGKGSLKSKGRRGELDRRDVDRYRRKMKRGAA